MRTIEIHGGKQGLYFEDHGEAGAGFVSYNEPRIQGTFTTRSSANVIQHKGKRYHVRGGIRTAEFITIGNHIKLRAQR
jgi:hypothetical protein